MFIKFTITDNVQMLIFLLLSSEVQNTVVPCAQLCYFRSYAILNWVQKTRVKLFSVFCFCKYNDSAGRGTTLNHKAQINKLNWKGLCVGKFKFLTLITVTSLPKSLAEFSLVTNPTGDGVLAIGGINGSDRQSAIYELFCNRFRLEGTINTKYGCYIQP